MSKLYYPVTSPYAATTQTTWYMSRYHHRPIPPHSEDTPFLITAKYEFRPDLLSDDLYGTPAYWWIFAVRNRSLINDPIWDMTTGKTIIIPSATHLNKSIGS